jgi:GTP-binding protein
MPELYRKIWFAEYAPAVTISGVSRKRITKVFPIIDGVIEERKKRIPTGELNRFFREVVSRLSLPLFRGKAVKMYYMTQVGLEPPTFVIFSNYSGAVKDSHLRFLEKRLREYFGFEGTPIRIHVRPKRRET